MRLLDKALSALLFGAIALTFAPLTSAAELGFYVGGQYGKISKDESPAVMEAYTLGLYGELGYVPDVRSNTFESDDETWGFFGGYRILNNLAFEGGYMSVGKDVLREYSSGTFVDDEGTPVVESWTTSFGVRATGFAISAVGVLPVTYNWEVFAKGGVFLASNVLSYYAVNQTGFGGADQITESSADFLVGAGAAYLLAEVYELRLEYQRILDQGAKEFGEQDVDLLTVGITVRF